MKALVFAAGLGTRLKPFTESHPKALVSVAGVPMLQRVIEKLKAAGVDEFIVNVHHFSSQIVDFLAANNNYGVTIHISDESDRLLDTGGGIVAASRWIAPGEDFIVHNADILTDFDIREMLSAHRQSGALATLLVASRHTSRYFLMSPGDHRLHGWTNVNTGEIKPSSLTDISGFEKLAFGGIHIISSDMLKPLHVFAETLGFDGTRATVPKFSIVDFYLSACSSICIQGYIPSAPYRWHDIGKPDALLTAEADFVRPNL